MKINVESYFYDSIVTISIRLFDGVNLGEDIADELATNLYGWCEMDLHDSEAQDEIWYWREEVRRANAGLINDILEPLTPEQIANGCAYVFDWREVD